MKQLKWFIHTCSLALIFASCSPKAYVEKDPSIQLSSYKTYAWVDTRASKTLTDTRPTEFAKLPIENAVNQKLRKDGWILVDKNPDVLLAYDILVEKNFERHTDPIYTQPFGRFYYNPFFNRWGIIYFPSHFMGYESYGAPVREATITITMIDAKTDKKVWQGWTTEKVKSVLLSKREIRNGVNSIFKKLDTHNPSADVAMSY